MLTPTSNIKTQGDLGGQKVAMTFDEASITHLMSLMIDAYSDPEAAVIREYPTNALDSHREAGNTEPILVSSPSAFSPYFIVQDFGVGLSVDDIVNMYSKYGASTKRETNEQVGMLGIGAKSALSLVQQFKIVAIKNGIRIEVSVSRDASNAGHMEIIDTRATTERNGVTITIPISTSRVNSVQRKIKEFFRFWEPGTVLVDGKEPIGLSGNKVGEKFIIDGSLNQDYVVMGNVAYPVKDGLYAGGYYYSHMGIVARVEIGEVNFTPSREELQYTKHTKETIERLRREFSAELTASIIKDISTAKDHSEAWQRAEVWRSKFSRNVGTLYYKGVEIPTTLALGVDFKDVDLYATRAARYGSWLRYLDGKSFQRYLFIVGFADTLKVSAVQRQRIQKYCEQNGLDFNRAAVTNKQRSAVVSNDWTKGMVFADWKDIAKIKVEIQRTAANGARVARTDPYDLYGGGGRWDLKSVSTLDTTKDIIYISPTEDRSPSHLKELYPDAQIVMLNMNRWDKFKRDWPTAKHYRTKMNEDRLALATQITDDDRILNAWSGQSYLFVGLDYKALDDPEAANFLKVLKTGKYSDVALKLRLLGGSFGDAPENPLTRYPMYGNLSRTSTAHNTWYFNSYYRDFLKEN